MSNKIDLFKKKLLKKLHFSIVSSLIFMIANDKLCLFFTYEPKKPDKLNEISLKDLL